MNRSVFRTCVALLASALLLGSSSYAMDTQLSEEAVREAYFLGQRHDQRMADLLSQYVRNLAAPETGPYVSSVTFYTPYALAVVNASQHSFNYHAQDAEREHLRQPEVVRVVIQVSLTDSYGPYLMQPANSSSATVGIRLRSSDFWKDFRVHIFSEDGKEQRQVFPVDAGGEPTFRCDEYSCILGGATIHFDLPAEAFTAECATVRVDPPEGTAVSVEFELNSLR